MKLTVFVSHIHEDAEVAKRIKDWLEDRLLGAVDVFVSSDGSSIRGGDRWMDTVENALRASKIVIILCTPSSTQRRWVFFEAGGAFFLGARVIPVCGGGLSRDKLEAPLSFLHAFHLNDSDHLRQLLAEIANHAGLRTPSVDLSADAQWIVTGSRIASQPSPQITSKNVYTPLSFKEANERAAQVPQGHQTAAHRALLMFEFMFDVFFFREGAPTEFEEVLDWLRHFVTKLQAAGLPIPIGTAGSEGKRRATEQEIIQHLRTLATQEGWTKVDALLDLEPLLPEAIPVVVRDILVIQDLERHGSLGWHIQLDLLKRLTLHGDLYVVRLIGTLARRVHFATRSDFTGGLLRYARQILPDESEFERWFLEFARIKYEDYQVRQEKDGRESEERMRRALELRLLHEQSRQETSRFEPKQ